MSLTLVGKADAAAASVALPAFSAGDIAIVYAFNGSSTTTPTLPSGWTNIGNNSANSCAARWGYRVLVGTDTTTGTWTNATGIEVIVLRGQDTGDPIGAAQSAGSTGSSTTPSWSAFTAQNLVGGNWLLFFGGHKTATDMNSIALGSTTNESPATSALAMHDIQGNTANWSATTKTVNASSGWSTAIVEINVAGAAHLSQLPVEVVELPTDSEGRLSQLPVEVIELPIPAGRLSQLPIEVVATRTNVAVLSQIPVEVIQRNLLEVIRIEVID